MLTRRFLMAATAALSLSALAPAFAEEAPIMVIEPYARANGGVGATGAAFFMLHNMGSTDDRLVAAKADATADKVELHTHIMDDAGVMKMVEVKEGFPVAAGAMHELKRGADHVMLMGLKVALKDGDIVPLTLVFESGLEIQVDVPVDNARMPVMGEMDHGTGG